MCMRCFLCVGSSSPQISPQYLLVMLLGKASVSANLFKTSAELRESCVERRETPGSQNLPIFEIHTFRLLLAAGAPHWRLPLWLGVLLVLFCHIPPPSEIGWGLFSGCLYRLKGEVSFPQTRLKE